MIPLLALWTRRLWPFATLTALVAGGMLAVALLRGRHDTAALTKAHAVTAAKVDTVRILDTVYREAKATARRQVGTYHAKRDTALMHITDTLAVKEGFAACDSALGGLYSALSSADRLLQAHVRYEYALRSELAASERLRAPRYQVTTRAGVEWATLVPLTELESTVRITHDWSVGGRVSKRWAAGEPTRRYVMASRTF